MTSTAHRRRQCCGRWCSTTMWPSSVLLLLELLRETWGPPPNPRVGMTVGWLAHAR